jgi:hypothetical protein
MRSKAADAEAARAEAGRVRADAEKMPAAFRAEAVGHREELRARAERADAYRGGLARLRAGTGRDTDLTAPGRPPGRAWQATQP